MDSTPQGSRAIRARIKRYQKALEKEKAEFGLYGDSYGKRYLLGPLYLLAGDVPGALRSFTWFEQEFPDDTGEPFQYLCWCLTLLRSGQMEAASQKVSQGLLQNPYLIPHLLGEEPSELDIWHSSSDMELSYLEYLPREYEQLWTQEELAWLRQTYHSPKVQAVLQEAISIHRQLRVEPVGATRRKLVNRLRKLAER